ncbi:MAG: ATP-binding protein [Candidatus Omnitrophica bacterium]|nr:ATP-binding protein [Candidatus Omnitrophota bacterium]
MKKMSEWPLWSISQPSNVLLSGPSGCGKTTWVQRLLANPILANGPHDTVYYVYGIHNENVHALTNLVPNLVAFEGFPRDLLAQPSAVFSPKKKNLIIFDDLQQELNDSVDFTNFLTRCGHHLNCSCINLEHHLFQKSSKEKTKQRLSYHIIVLFRNPMANEQVGIFARQIGIANTNLVKFAFNDATQNVPHGYLVIDASVNTPNECRLLTNVFSDECPVICYAL